MKIYVFNIDPEEIKNPISSIPNSRYGFSHLYDAQAEAFENGKQAILAHTHEIDISELSLCIADVIYPGKYRKIKEAISQFLQDKLKQENKLNKEKKMDKELAKIIKDTLSKPNEKCPDCLVEGTVRGSGEVAWCECPKCHGRIGDVTVV